MSVNGSPFKSSINKNDVAFKAQCGKRFALLRPRRKGAENAAR
jgi:hypothetical protein